MEDPDLLTGPGIQGPLTIVSTSPKLDTSEELPGSESEGELPGDADGGPAVGAGVVGAPIGGARGDGGGGGGGAPPPIPPPREACDGTLRHLLFTFSLAAFHSRHSCSSRRILRIHLGPLILWALL